MLKEQAKLRLVLTYDFDSDPEEDYMENFLRLNAEKETMRDFLRYVISTNRFIAHVEVLEKG
jgi:hypothetical protein